MYVIAPRRGEHLDGADIFGQVTGDVRISVELDLHGYAPSAVSALADLVATGYNIEIRGGRFAAMLAAEVEVLAELRPQ